MTSQFILAAVFALVAQSTPAAGSISGQVVNASRNMTPVAGAEVILRVRLEGQFVVAAEGVSDEQGRFAFDNIPADDDYIYLPGANRDGIHYPGPRVRLTATTPNARVQLTVNDTFTEPNPLVLRRHDITIQPETDALRVTESLLIENPTNETYIGLPEKEGGRAATLRLCVPSDFRRTTFAKEFYGRQFTLIDGQLVTDIPWTPGQRELAFTYVLPNENRYRVWQRPLDLPCDQLRIAVETGNHQQVSCNLPRAASTASDTVSFESTGQSLPAGHVIRLELGRLPVSIASYGRWLALFVLVGLIGATTILGILKRKRKKTKLIHFPPSVTPNQAA